MEAGQRVLVTCLRRAMRGSLSSVLSCPACHPSLFLLVLCPDESSVKEDAGDGPGGVGRQVGGLRGGPLVPLCAQPEPMDLGREKVVQHEHDRFGTALEVQLLEFLSGRSKR